MNSDSIGNPSTHLIIKLIKYILDNNIVEQYILLSKYAQDVCNNTKRHIENNHLEMKFQKPEILFTTSYYPDMDIS